MSRGATSVRVAHYSRTWLSQTETWLYNQVRYLPARVRSCVICEHTRNLDQFAVEDIRSLEEEPWWKGLGDRGMRKLGLRRHLSFTVAQLKSWDAHVLHSHFGPKGWKNLNAAEQAGVGHVVTFYGYDVNYYPQEMPEWRDRYRQVFQRVDRVLCEGSHMRDRIVQLGCPPSRVKVHRLGVPVDQIEFRPRRFDGHGPLRVLLASSFQEKKGIPYAMEALAGLADDVPVSISVVGDSVQQRGSEREKKRILDVVRRGGIESCVRWMGFQPHQELLRLALDHHVLVQASVTAESGDTEGGAPVALIEMAATGMPIVSTYHCDIPDVVREGETGYLAPERDAKALEGCLRRLLNEAPSWPSMGRAARRHVEQRFDAVKQGRRLADIYENVVQAVR